MALTQMQLIQSLGEALAWFEREINWGIPATELRHLCGRVGELYVAMITNGQMAMEVNQQGYDVVSAGGERISVKTTAQSGYDGQVSFNPNSLSLVDRVILLRVNTDEMQVEILMDKPISEARDFMSTQADGRLVIPFRRIRPPSPVVTRTVNEVAFREYIVRELETGTIEVFSNGVPVTPVKPVLRDLALALNIGLLNGNGNPHNTRQLGTQIIKSVKELTVVNNAPDDTTARQI